MDRNKAARERVFSEREKKRMQLEAEYENDKKIYEQTKQWLKRVPDDTKERLDEMLTDKEAYQIQLLCGLEIVNPRFKFEQTKEWTEFQIELVKKKVDKISKSVTNIKKELNLEMKKRKAQLAEIEEKQSDRVKKLKKLGVEKDWQPKKDYIG